MKINKRKANKKQLGSEKYRESLGAFGYSPFTSEKETKLIKNISLTNKSYRKKQGKK